MSTEEERERVIRDLKFLINGPFLSTSIITSNAILAELRKLGDPMYEDMSDYGITRLVGDVLGNKGRQFRMGQKRYRGYNSSVIRDATSGTGGTREMQMLAGTGGTGGTGPLLTHVYIIGAIGVQAVKIGAACNSMSRMGDMQIGCPLQLALLWQRPTLHAFAVEHALHKRFWEHRIRGEWFNLGIDPVPVIASAFKMEELEIRKMAKKKVLI